ncbi:hypothetical protein HGO34_12660 [Agrobacterium vitis]|uniref:Uncharacterized protein n=1 Tax=Agrobacterium vitis TaxID=373 RepID=A0AAE4WGP6_AGRVI|nr:hypothetical protein [Agrobacterium vitis]MCF1501207.1 hypothetical protein [Allorhizobium sp. Av2]MCM2440567.1 hypothetical protein [Agrobacterium vitis]MUZ59553.1 hypothetical protein [Agrobacterium vitis]MVA66685.1 hypothetical protein [Agrobacterium vitis]MVA87548.1 hypothetical protein [Agrobacterium vitis]
MNEPLKNLLDAARKVPQSKADLEVQRRSFAYGNTHFENDKITREMVERIADETPMAGDINPTARR